MERKLWIAITYLPKVSSRVHRERVAICIHDSANPPSLGSILVEKLQYEPQEAETLACSLEHAIQGETAQRLAEYLGWPNVSPQGKTIPHVGSKGNLQTGSPINKLPANTTGIVTSILSEDEDRAYLEQAGIAIGSSIFVKASQSNGPSLIESSTGITVNLSAELSKSIWVQPNPDEPEPKRKKGKRESCSKGRVKKHPTQVSNEIS